MPTINDRHLPVVLNLGPYIIHISRNKVNPKLDSLRKLVEFRLGLPNQIIQTKNRTKNVARARQDFITLAVKNGFSQTEIGKYLKCTPSNIQKFLSKSRSQKTTVEPS